MNLEINQELAELRPTLRQFAMEKLEPLALECDRIGAIPDAAWIALRDHGYLGLRMPTEYGGAGVGIGTYCLAMEEFGRSHRIFTAMLDYTSGLTPIGILKLGSEAQKAKYLRKLVDGTWRSAFALTEPGAGSDAQAISTRAEQCAGGWVLNGTKQYISGAHKADVIMVVAVTDMALRGRGGITTFLVDKGTPGMTVSRVDTTIGSPAMEVAELRFDDCRIPYESLLGEVGKGFAVAMNSLVTGRMGIASSCLGAAGRLVEMAVTHAKERKTFGQPLADRQAIQWMISDSIVELEQARAYVYETLRRLEAGEDVGTASSICKLSCTEMAGQVADRAVQIHGGMGVIKGFPVERFYRDLRHYRITEGSSEVQRMLISRDALR